MCFLLCLFWGNSWFFKRSILISLFVVNFRKVLKHWWKRLNSTSKNGSILRFNHLYGFWSSSLSSQIELFTVLVFGKVCFNLIKLASFVLFLFSPFYCFLFYFGFSFLLFLQVPDNSPQRKLPPPPPPVGIRVWVSFSVRARIEGNSPRANCPRTVFTSGKKEIFCMPTKC